MVIPTRSAAGAAAREHVFQLKDEKSGGVRVTHQFRAGAAMAYDLRDESSRVTVKICERQSSTKPGAFRVDVATGGGPEALVITGWGATRAEALREAGRSWTDARLRSALPSFDWEAVAHVLRAVRAV
jgi:hypothetical protein